jgi:hypothetical protein
VSNPAGVATLSRGINITSVTRAAVGVVDLVLVNDGSDMTNATVIATSNSASARTATGSVVVGAPNKVRVYTWDTAGAAIDVSFFVTVWGW